MHRTVIVSEKDRPYWHFIIGAMCFTTAAMLILSLIFGFSVYPIQIGFKITLFFIGHAILIGLGFCAHKRIYLDIENSKFRSTYEIGNLKMGRWKTIRNYSYLSIFPQIFRNDSFKFRVNLWCNNNLRHELYVTDDLSKAYNIGYQLATALNIDLLDATRRHDYRWIDVQEWTEQIKNEASRKIK